MPTKNQKVHGIVHAASTAVAAVAAGLAQLPRPDAPVIARIQMTMLIADSAAISKAAAGDRLLTFAATHVERGISQWHVGWVPGWGNASNVTTPSALTEAIGWAATYFGEETQASA